MSRIIDRFKSIAQDIGTLRYGPSKELEGRMSNGLEFPS